MSEQRQYCDLADDCACAKTLKRGGAQQVFCRHWKAKETPEDDVHRQSVANWQKLPAAQREALVEHLRKVIVGNKEQDFLVHWARQAAQGMAIGSDSLRFHFQEGMAARNILRQKLTDRELPPVLVQNYEGSGELEPTQNWDDFYYGALKELVA